MVTTLFILGIIKTLTKLSQGLRRFSLEWLTTPLEVRYEVRAVHHINLNFLWYNFYMKQIDSITPKQLCEMAQKMYGSFVKGVVDIRKKLLVLDAEMHADEEQYLLEMGSKQEDLWGINLYPEKFGSNEFIEFDSMINIRPSQKNLSRGVEDETIRNQIIGLIKEKVKP